MCDSVLVHMYVLVCIAYNVYVLRHFGLICFKYLLFHGKVEFK